MRKKEKKKETAKNDGANVGKFVKKSLEEAPANEQAKENELKNKLSLVELDGFKRKLTLIITVRGKCMVTLDLFLQRPPVIRSRWRSDGRRCENITNVGGNIMGYLSTQVRSGTTVSQGPSSSNSSSSGSGNEDTFGLEPAWMPYMHQSQSGMSSLLSFKTNIGGHFRQMLHDFPPAVLSLYLLGKKKLKQMIAPHKSALANGIFRTDALAGPQKHGGRRKSLNTHTNSAGTSARLEQQHRVCTASTTIRSLSQGHQHIDLGLAQHQLDGGIELDTE
ncbi:hypothetical protein RFI_40345 [Reticulomyxa filosa]|uniref:Uncharacterized protein n=1 Tax=Reticulomyxa filosa TaxID=46433 RepID=X6L828_RETFI|nr:hypothetical protein RFI_40345 [Reticulomyxa filosa]|eukprot:ETN97186.1 hypothetical protein RFI_40345 [Reticulomyxa filosa]